MKKTPLRGEAGLLRWGDIGLRPNRTFASRLSSDAGRFNQGSLRSLIVVFFCFAWGVTLGCRPNLLGDFIPKPRLRFAAV